MERLFETLCQCIFKHRLADSIYVSSLSLLLLLSPKISKKHLNERQILAIQYISRGAYPSFANFCNRGEDYSLWAGKGELFLSNFSPRLWGVRKPFSHVQKPKRKKPFIFLQCTISIGFLVENHCFAIGLLQLDDNAIGDSSTMFFSCCI